jgi:hypothetical protein
MTKHCTSCCKMGAVTSEMLLNVEGAPTAAKVVMEVVGFLLSEVLVADGVNVLVNVLHICHIDLALFIEILFFVCPLYTKALLMGYRAWSGLAAEEEWCGWCLWFYLGIIGKNWCVSRPFPVHASQANDEFFIWIAVFSAMQMQCQKICNTDAPGTKLTTSYIEPCSAHASPKNLKCKSIAETPNLHLHCMALCRKL